MRVSQPSPCSLRSKSQETTVAKGEEGVASDRHGQHSTRRVPIEAAVTDSAEGIGSARVDKHGPSVCCAHPNL